MTKKRLKAYQTNKRIYNKLSEEIDKLREQLNSVKVVSGQVQASDKDWPYIMGHVQVEVQDPKPADVIRNRIIEREKRRKKIRKELVAVESYISRIKDPGERQIFSWIYLEGKTQEEVGDTLHYSQGRISQIINNQLQEEMKDDQVKK